MASTFTSEEIEIIDNIKEGIKELIENIISKRIKSPNEYANLDALTKIRPSAHIFLIYEILEIFRKDRNYIFRPIDLKKKLPDSLKVFEDYDSELTRILKSLFRSNLIVRSSKVPTKRGPGHPKQDEGKYYTISGPKSYYEASPFLIKIITIIDNPEARKIIFNYLSKSNILFDLYVNCNLIYPNLLKLNRFKAVKIIRETAHLKTNKTESDFEEQFEKDKEKIKDMKRKDITQKSKDWTKMKLNAFTPDDFVWLFPLGATYYIKDIIRYIPSKND